MNTLDRLKLRLSPDEVPNSDAVLEECLESARDAIMRRRFGVNREWPIDIEPQFVGLQIDIALDIYNKMGAEGQLSHSENGISRTYESSWISGELLRQIPPYCGVIR